MENSLSYQPQVWLLNSLNFFKNEVAVDSFSDDSNESNDVLDANDVVVLDGSPVKRNSSHIRNLF